MAAPVLQAQGATFANITGDLTVTLPAHQTDDILLLVGMYWAPVSGPNDDFITPSGWTQIGASQMQIASGNGLIAWFWKRAASSSEANPILGRPLGGDTGNDTCLGGRAFVIRGCITTGNPWDAVATAGPYTTANQNFPAVTVSGSQRMVVIFGAVTDNLSFSMASTGWTTGTEDNDPAGTNCAFQTARKNDVSASTNADASTVTAPGQGGYGFLGISFKPVPGTNYTKDLTETVSMIDSRNQMAGKVTVESILLEDSILRLVSQIKTETVSLVDTLLKSMATTKSEAVTLVDTRTNRPGKVASETVVLADAILKTLSTQKLEAILLSDTISKLTSQTKSETIALVDTVTKVLVIVRLFNETLSLVDSVVKQAQLKKTETIVLTESVIKSIAVIKSETAVLVDTLRKATSTTKSEILTLTDVLQTVLVIVRTFTETVILVDILRKQANLTKQEAIILNDTLLRQTQKRLSETAVLTDFIQKLIAMQKLEGVVLSDTVTAILAGVVEAVLIELLSAAVGLASAINTSDIKPASDIGSGNIKPAGQLENPAIEA